MSAVRTVGGVATLATLAAGLVAVLRQRSESGRVRRGDLAPASAASTVPPVREPGPVGRWFASWQPARPRTVAGRVAAAVWAAPLTLPGLVLATAGGARPRWDDDLACLVAAGVGGPSAVALAAVGADANAVGQVVLARSADPSPVLLRHEAVHVRQGERLGPLLLPVYVWLGARYGYRDHPLERAARAGARQATVAR